MSVPDRPGRTQDEWIALRCQAGDNTGFEDLVALMEPPLLYYAAKLTGNAQTAHDVALQDHPRVGGRPHPPARLQGESRGSPRGQTPGSRGYFVHQR